MSPKLLIVRRTNAGDTNAKGVMLSRLFVVDCVMLHMPFRLKEFDERTLLDSGDSDGAMVGHEVVDVDVCVGLSVLCVRSFSTSSRQGAYARLNERHRLRSFLVVDDHLQADLLTRRRMRSRRDGRTDSQDGLGLDILQHVAGMVAEDEKRTSADFHCAGRSAKELQVGEVLLRTLSPQTYARLPNSKTDVLDTAHIARCVLSAHRVVTVVVSKAELGPPSPCAIEEVLRSRRLSRLNCYVFAASGGPSAGLKHLKPLKLLLGDWHTTCSASSPLCFMSTNSDIATRYETA